MNARLSGVDTEAHRPRRIEESGMLNVFLHSGSSVMDFILLGRGSGIPVPPKGFVVKEKFRDFGRCSEEDHAATAVAKHLDDLTDAKTVREARVYRMMLVGCECE